MCACNMSLMCSCSLQFKAANWNWVPICIYSMHAMLLKAGNELRCPIVMATLSTQGEGFTKDTAAYAGAASASQRCPQL